MVLVLYGKKTSTCTRRVLAALHEKNVDDYRLEDIDLAGKQQKSPEFLKKQPFGQIPVLEDGDFQVFESRAIARYIADKFISQGTDLLGSTLEERAIINQWAEVECHQFNPPIQALVREKVILPRYGLKGDDAKAAENAQQLGKVLDIYEAHLAHSQYLAGDKFSLADLSHLPYTQMLWPAGYSELIQSRPNVNAWWERISSRPSWEKVKVMK